MLDALIKESKAALKILRRKKEFLTFKKDYTKIPVIMIHGFTGGKSNLYHLAEFLQNNSSQLHNIHFYEYPVFQSLDNTIKKLHEFIEEEVLQYDDYMSVRLIGHSLGGTIARITAQERDDIEDVISLGSPYQFGPEIDTEKELAIFGGDDFVIPPPHDKHKYIVVSNVGHVGLIVDERVYWMILKRLV